MRRLIIIAALLFAAPAIAQNTVITRPLSVTSSNNVSTTIAVTNTFQSLWPANTTNNTGRTACTVINYGSNTMWVFFGPIASATKAASIQLAVGQATYCNVGESVINTQVSITGTSGEAFYAAQQ